MSALKPRARSWLLSMLLQRYATQRAQFLEECKTPWLVWEPGPWKPPSSDEDTVHLPTLKQAEALSEGTDLLCFHLMPAAKGDSVFRIGRERDNDIVISDATVSRRHLELHCSAAGRWTAIEVSTPERIVMLSSKTQLKLGGVKLTFLMPNDWVARIEAEARAPRGK